MVSEVVERFEAEMGMRKGEADGEYRVESVGRRGILGYRFGRKLVGELGEALWFAFVVFSCKTMWERWGGKWLLGGLRSIFRCFAGTVLMVIRCVFGHLTLCIIMQIL